VADIQGEVSGQVAVGEHILQMTVHGGVVNVAPPGGQTVPRLRPSPVLLRPRPFPHLLDREVEKAAIELALQTSQPIGISGPGGIGKTVILRHVAHKSLMEQFPAGIVYLSGRNRGVVDLLQSLFDALYESDLPIKASESQIRHHLAGKRALVLVDDAELRREEVGTLLDTAPDCLFLLASSQRQLWGEGRELVLKGLPLEDALTLVERELGRSLSEEETPAAETLWEQLEGHPLYLLQAAAEAREEGRPLRSLAQEGPTGEDPDQGEKPPPPSPLLSQLLSTLPKEARRVLAVLAALGDGPTYEQHLSALTGLDAQSGDLKGLQKRRLVQTHSPSYSLTGDLGQQLRGLWGLDQWSEGALRYFDAWADSAKATPESVWDAADNLLHLVQWAASNERWSDSLKLGRVLEETLIVNLRWDAWKQLSAIQKRAAQGVKDHSSEAWSLHQNGTRALCLGDRATAEVDLRAALDLRKQLGEEAAVAVTQHNLDLLLALPPVKEEQARQVVDDTPIVPNGGTVSGIPLLVKALIVLLIVGMVVVGGYQVLIGSSLTTIQVINEGCGVLGPTPAWLDALPGVELFDRIPPGQVGVVQFPTRLLSNSQVLVEQTGEKTVVKLTTMARSFSFPVDGRVQDVLLDGEPVFNRPIPVDEGGKHELIIICE
jgi:hypothetical protein